MKCEKCGADAHRDDSMARRCNPCERLTRLCICKEEGDVALWKGDLPIYYNFDVTVTGKAEAVKKPSGSVVIELTLRPGEDSEKILAMLQENIPLALNWTVRRMEAKRVPNHEAIPKEGGVQAPQDTPRRRNQ